MTQKTIRSSRFIASGILSGLTGLGLLVSAGCATDNIEADVMFAIAPGSGGADFAPLVIGGAIPDGASLFLRIDGKDLVDGEGIASDSRISVQEGGVFASNIPAGDHVVELVDGEGVVTLRTDALRFESGRFNDLLVFGDPQSLSFNYSADDWSAVSDGSVRANFFNANMRKLDGTLELCSYDSDASTEAEAESCEQLGAIAYGSGWSGEVAPGTTFVFTPDGTDIRFVSMRHGDPGFVSTSVETTRVNAFYALDWVDSDASDCPGCTSSIMSTEAMFIQP